MPLADMVDRLQHIDELHQPLLPQGYQPFCRACGEDWQCRTHKLIHDPLPNPQ